ncbi:MAG: ATP-binding cassette domain-containing protein [Actinomycetaceae bacterium]|nr:ATP-binding cassette domain-containing protein [Actinomycetaceae bacterium]
MTDLKFENIEKSFGNRKVLKDVTLTINPGELYGFVGANGAGKTTLMRIAMGIADPDRGRVTSGGAVLDVKTRKTIGYMPEERGLYSKMKVGAQLEYLAKLHGCSKTEAIDATKKWARRLNIFERLDDPVEKLSLGNQQRVQLAAALVFEPKILILDEPFSGLDPLAVDIMSDVMREYARSGVLVMFSSHQLDLVERICDRIGIIQSGRLVAEGTVEQLRRQGRPAVRLVGDTVAVAVARERALSAGISPVLQDETKADPGHIFEDGRTVAAPSPLGTAGAEGGTGAGALEITLPIPLGDLSQVILRAATKAGVVEEFGPVRRPLSEIFRDVTMENANEGGTESGNDLGGRRSQVETINSAVSRGANSAKGANAAVAGTIAGTEFVGTTPPTPSAEAIAKDGQ